MRYKRKSSVNPKTDNAVVHLGRLPKWISEQKTVKVLIKSQGCVITSLPSSPVWKEYRTMNSFCGKNLSQSPNQNLVDGRRLTRSTGGDVKVDFMAKLPDDRNYRCKILGACSDQFLGFELRHHAIYLLNNDAFPCLSELQDKVDFVLAMAITEARCSDEGCSECPLVEDAPELTASNAGGSMGRHRKLQGKEGKPKKCGQLVRVKRKGAQCSSSLNVPLRKGKEECGKDFCRLGCMCDSLKAKRKRVHCGHADCMFSKHCIRGPNFTPRDSSRLTLLSAEAKSPEMEGGLAKRQRRPPKRWLEEEEEHDILAEVKKKSKLFVQKSPPKSKEAEEAESASELTTDTNHPEINEKSSEPNSVDSHDESAFKLKRPICVAIKSISGKQRFKSSLFRYSVPDEPYKAHCSHEGNPGGESSSNFYSPQRDTHADKPSCSKDSSYQDISLKKYFRNYKEYRKFFASGEVTDSQIACMLSSSLSPARVNCMVLMKWDVLEKMVKERLAYLWISQIPKCPVKIMVTDRDSPPDLTSTNLAKVENVGGFVSSVDYLFHLYKNNPERYGCCILSCHGLHWEIKGNLNLRTKLSERILIKVMRSCSKAFNELTFDNGGKRILICDSSSVSYTEEALGDNDATDEAVVESEINEIPEPDIQVYDPAAVQSTGSPVCRARNSAHSENTPSSPVSLAVENDLPSPSSEDTTSASETHRQASPDSTVSEKSHEEEVISPSPQSKPLVVPAPASKGFLDLSWYCLNLDRSFDKIIIDKPHFSATYTQMVYALRVSKERDIAVRVSCSSGSNYLFNNQIWKQGVYADYMISDISVKVGPYYNYEVPEIRAFVKVNGILIRTHVELSKEPLTPETMPRVSRTDSRTPARQTAQPSVSLLKSSSSRGMSEASSFGKNIESLSTRRGIDPLNRTTERPTSVGEKRTATDDLPVVTSTVNESLTQVDTIDETDDPCSMSSVTIKKEPREEMDSELSDESKSDFSMKIESVQGNWSGFDDIMNPTHDDSTDFGACIVAKECTDSSETTMKSLLHVSGAAVSVVVPSSSNLAVVQKEILPTEMSMDSLGQVESPKCAVSRNGIHQVAAVLDPLMDTKSNVVTSNRADSISPRDVNSIADNSVTIKAFPVASKFRDSGSVCQVNLARRTVEVNSVASSVASEGNPSSAFIAERFRLIDENGLNAAVVLKLSPFTGTLYADRVSKSDTKPVVSNSVAMESPASDTIITKRTSSVAPASIEQPGVCAVNPVSVTSTAQRTNSVALACAESASCAVNPLSDTLIIKRTSKVSPSCVESSGSRAVNSSSDASVTKTSNKAAAATVDSTGFSAVAPSSVSSVAEGAGTVAPMPIECTGVRAVDPSPDISVSRRANITAAMPVDSTDHCAVNSLSGTLITKRTNVMATASAESTDVNPFSDTSMSYAADSVAMNSKESSALELTSKSGTMRARRSKSVGSVSKESARQKLNRKSDAKRTKLDAAKSPDLTVYKGESSWDDGPSDSCKAAADATVVKGFLVSDLKCLKAIAVTKTALNVIRFADPSWHLNKIPPEFRCEEEASAYLNTFTNVKMYPDDYVLKWTFVESKRFFHLKHGDDLIDIRTVDDGDHFITSKGVFRYDDVTAENLAKCGLGRDDNRRLLELRRRREIRSAKNELINLLPDSMKTDVLMKVIYRSWSLIHSLEEKGRALCQTLVTENTRKGFLLAKLRNMCSGETMYKIYEELEKIARPRAVADVECVAPVQKPIRRKQRAPQQRRKPKKRCKPRGASSKAVRKSSKQGVSTPAAVFDQPVKTIKVLKPVVRTVQVHPLTENSSVKEEKATMLPPLSFLPVFEAFDEPPVKVLDKLPVKELDEPPTKVPNEARVKVLNEPPVKVLEESVIKKHKQPKSRSSMNRNRELFSGRYVSAATKRSLRKYNFIIPCLARKHHSLLKKSSPDTVDGQKVLDTRCNSVSPLHVSNEGAPAKQEENDEGVRDEEGLAGVRNCVNFDGVGKLERPPDDIAPNDERNFAESSHAGCGDESMVFEENAPLQDEFCSPERISVSVKQEVEDYDEELNELIQEDLEALPSEESDIEVD
ncbi:uncharacterized protein LOC124161863 isoform X2 [Ischnura elegans]|uniref:uncharacterized protein LOC124161863 isoform X2 n=1 Tax=Ischnura elegans TaxID=197161 RepID=UPI001ED88F23|nr:uncharacterized protein LOC124161863 isoform X2 [Ischnura elegans]